MEKAWGKPEKLVKLTSSFTAGLDTLQRLEIEKASERKS